MLYPPCFFTRFLFRIFSLIMTLLCHVSFPFSFGFYTGQDLWFISNVIQGKADEQSCGLKCVHWTRPFLFLINTGMVFWFFRSFFPGFMFRFTEKSKRLCAQFPFPFPLARFNNTTESPICQHIFNILCKKYFSERYSCSFYAYVLFCLIFPNILRW